MYALTTWQAIQLQRDTYLQRSSGLIVIPPRVTFPLAPLYIMNSLAKIKGRGKSAIYSAVH